MWNGRDPILKERVFGLTGAEANHGEDVKEHWWYLDAVPSHAWNRWRYHYPQGACPYETCAGRTAVGASSTRSMIRWPALRPTPMRRRAAGARLPHDWPREPEPLYGAVVSSSVLALLDQTETRPRYSLPSRPC